MSDAIADLYVALTAQTAPMMDAFLAAGKAGDDMAAQIIQASEASAEAIRTVGTAAESMAAQVDASGRAAAAGLAQISAAAKLSADEVAAAQAKTAAAVKAGGSEMAAAAAAGAAGTEAAAARTTAATEKSVGSFGATGAAAKASGSEIAAASAAGAAGVESAAAKTEGFWSRMRTGATTAAAGVQAGWSKISGASASAEKNIETGMKGGTGAVRNFASQTNVLMAGAAAGLVAETTKLSMNFNAQMEKITTNAHAPQAEVDALKQKVLDLAPTVGIGPEKLAEALYHIESVGLRGKDAMALLEASAKGAQIGLADLDTVAYAMSGVMSVGMKDVKGAADGVAYLNTIVGQGDMSMQGLATAIGTGVLPAFKNAQLGMADFGAALSTLTDNSVPPQVAANHLKTSIMLMQNQSGPAEKALAELGIGAGQLGKDLAAGGLEQALTDVKSHMEAFTPAGGKVKLSLQQIQDESRKFHDQLIADGAGEEEARKATDKYTESLNSNGSAAVQAGALLAKAFGGARSAATMETLTEETHKFHDKLVEMGTAESRAKQLQEDWNKTQEQTRQKLDQAKSSAQTLGTEIGITLAPAVNKLLDAFAGLATWLTQHQTAMKAVAIVLGTIVAGALVVLTGKVLGFVLGPAKTLVGWFVSAGRYAGTWARETQEAAALMARMTEEKTAEAGVAVEKLATTTTVAADKVVADNERMAASAKLMAEETVVADREAGLAAEGLAAKTGLAAAGGGAVIAGGAAAKGGKHAKGGAAMKGGGGLGLMLGTMAAGAIMQGTTDENAPEGSIQAAINHAGGALNFDFSGIAKDAKALPSELSALGGRISQSALGRELSDLFGPKKQHQTSIIPRGGAETGDGSTNANSNLDPTKIATATQKTATQTQSAWQKITQQFDQGKAKIGTAIEAAAKTVEEKGKAAGDGMLTGLKSGWTATETWLGQRKADVAQKLSDAGTWLTDRGKAAWDGFHTAVTTAYEKTSAWLGQRKTAVQQFFSDAGTWLVQHARELWDGFQKTVADAYQAASKWWSDRKTQITNFFSDAGTWLVNAGKAIMEGFLNGLKSAWGAVQSFVGGIGDWIAAHKGPVEVDRLLLVEHGDAVMDGFHRGMRERFERTREWIRGIHGQLSGDVKDGQRDGGSAGGSFSGQFQHGHSGTYFRSMQDTYWGVGGDRDARHKRPDTASSSDTSSSSSGSSSSTSDATTAAGKATGDKVATGVTSGLTSGSAKVKTAADKMGKDALATVDKTSTATAPKTGSKVATGVGAGLTTGGAALNTQAQTLGAGIPKGVQTGMDSGLQSLINDATNAGQKVLAALGGGLGAGGGSRPAGFIGPVANTSGGGAQAMGTSLMTSLDTGLKAGEATVVQGLTQWVSQTFLKVFYTAWGMTSQSTPSTVFTTLATTLMTSFNTGLTTGEAVVITAITAWAALSGPFVMAFLTPWSMSSPTDAGSNTLWYKLGLAIDNGIIAGLKAGQSAVAAAAKAVAAGAAQAANDGAGVQSPSWKTTLTGHFMAEGVENGWRARMFQTVATVHRQMADLAGGMSRFIPNSVRSSAFVNGIINEQKAWDAERSSDGSSSGGSSGGGGGDYWTPRGYGDGSGWFGLGGLPGQGFGYDWGGGGWGGGRGGYGGGWGGGERHHHRHKGHDKGGRQEHHYHFNIQGNVWRTADLLQEVQEGLMRHGIRNTTSGSTFTSFGQRGY